MKRAKSFNNVGAWFIVTIAVAIVVLAVVARNRATAPENPCIMDNPPVVVSGEILPGWGSPHNHYLWYKGKWKLTGEACKTRRRVTEKEYERRIYGH